MNPPTDLSQRESKVIAALTVHGVLPPPVTGMTACTQSLIELTRPLLKVDSYNWSNSMPKITPRFRLAKLVRALGSPWKLLFSRRAEQHVFYMPANSGLALYLNMFAIAAARIRGYRCALHHHIYTYLNRYDWRIELLDLLLGQNGLHLVLCPHMEQQLRALYSCRPAIAVVPSSIQLLQSSFAKDDPVPLSALPQRFRLGHIANLSIAKGLPIAIDTLRALRQAGSDVQLVLAGPVQSQVEQRMIVEAQAEFGSALEYRGPVYGAEKRRFYDEVHVVLFPTRYPDAQPLVVTEAFGCGRPVLSYGRGCIPGMMGARAEWSIDPSADFVAQATRQIRSWEEDGRAFAAACLYARQRYEQMLADADSAINDFVTWVRGRGTDGFEHQDSQAQLSSLRNVGL
ncbi:MAG: glycosyltransferase family 4 protein [Pirellulales bacterium]